MNIPRGILITMGEDASGAASIWFWGSTTATSSIEVAAYDNSANLLNQQASAYAPGALSNQWHEIPLSGTFSASNTDPIEIFVYDTDNSGTLYHENTGLPYLNGRTDFYSNLYSSGWVDPHSTLNPGDQSKGYYIYLEYTAGGGGVGIPIVMRHRKMLGMS